MSRLLAACLLCFACCAGKPCFASNAGPPWVSCFAAPPSHRWIGPRTVRTSIIQSIDDRLGAYAQIEARSSQLGECRNTIRLFVSGRKGAAFQQVYVQKPSQLGGNADSLGPVSWSPDRRWLLVERGNWFYASDAGGLDLLLYDTAGQEVVLPNLRRMLNTALGESCDVRVDSRMSFDTQSRVHLELSDYVDEGEDEPQTHCFRGSEKWVFDPRKGTMRPLTAITQ